VANENKVFPTTTPDVLVEVIATLEHLLAEVAIDTPFDAGFLPLFLRLLSDDDPLNADVIDASVDVHNVRFATQIWIRRSNRLVHGFILGQCYKMFFLRH